MDNLTKVREYLRSYSRLDQAVGEIDEIEAQRDEKSNYELFQEDGVEEHAKPSYFQAADDSDTESEPEVEDNQSQYIPDPEAEQVEGYIQEPLDDYADEEVDVVFTSDWKQPELESDEHGKTLRLTLPEGLSGEQKSQWLSTIKAVVQSAKYWNLAECTFEASGEGVIMKERQMTPDVYKVTPVMNIHPSQSEAVSDVWSLSKTSMTFQPKKASLQPLTISLDELFSSRGEFISVGGNGRMSHKEAILLGLRYKKLYNQARVKYYL
uniref:Phosphoprotein n=1 Tax=Vesicular stomatitis Indiana virus TaxID=11277 RepID=A0A140DCD4_9RHAB|nr:phosphoprotein [Vesicular stomatitis Indiana virus]